MASIQRVSNNSHGSVEEIKKAVLDCCGTPCHVFTEPRLSHEFGFPRNLLRLAVRELAEEELITTLPRKGFKVNAGKVLEMKNGVLSPSIWK